MYIPKVKSLLQSMHETTLTQGHQEKKQRYVKVCHDFLTAVDGAHAVLCCNWSIGHPHPYLTRAFLVDAAFLFRERLFVVSETTQRHIIIIYSAVLAVAFYQLLRTATFFCNFVISDFHRRTTLTNVEFWRTLLRIKNVTSEVELQVHKSIFVLNWGTYHTQY